MAGPLEDKVALAVGAGSIAEVSGDRGARLFALDIDPVAVEETVAIIDGALSVRRGRAGRPAQAP